MSLMGSNEISLPSPGKAKHLDDGIVKFPPNVHSLRVQFCVETGNTQITAKQNGVILTFVIEDDDCRHLARLLTAHIAPSKDAS
jgi:hypothetical protein